ncbi:MAG TPA: dethiobiotin synthase, partial [Candidatus Caenarcaniphilales bacterium]
MKTLLICGTDTEVGKTVLTTALAAYCLHNLGRLNPLPTLQSVAIFKPIQTGSGDSLAPALGDCEHYCRLFSLNQSPEEVTPLKFQAPLAPPIAAEQENRHVDLERVWTVFQSLQQRHNFILIEALGGLGSPVTYETTVADLARDWRLPVVLVVPIKLGAIAQAVANVALACQSQIHLKGIVLNCVQPCTAEEVANWAPQSLIQSLTNTPVLGMLPHFSDLGDLT